jgi:dTDP-4-dehydrorhamnose reductase
MKILVLGGSGMLGHKMFQVLRQRFPDTFATIKGSLSEPSISKIGILQSGDIFENFDATDFCGVQELLAKHKPNFVVNCIGIIKQRKDAKSHIPSITINSLLPHKLAEICEAWGGRVIHFSTDCVFSGRKGNYTEEDASDAEDLYGKSKYLGEVDSSNALTLRTSIIGRELATFSSLLEWFLAQQGKTVKGFTRAYYSGVTTNHLAGVVADLIENHPALSGLYQVTGHMISKFDLLCLIRDVYKLNIEVCPDDSFSCDRSISGEKFHRATGYVCAARK